jgi:phosphoribosylformylglycinamidine cyclo-ligase
MSKYEESGVSIDAGDSFVARIKELCKITYGYGVVEGVGQFCSLYHAPGGSDQLIAASTDGVGTKSLLSQQLSEYGYLRTIGIDLVAMVVNDILTVGAMPLFVLDYFAMSNLKVDEKGNFSKSEQIIRGIVAGCQIAGCALIGGETSEMPDMYDENKFDLAAFAIGMIQEKDVLGPHLVKSGDIILGIESTGPHSNGYSLIRHAYRDFDWKDNEEDTRRWLMAPTRIYTRLINNIISEPDHGVHAMAHITGGGLEYNTTRVIPQNLKACIDWCSWPRPDIFIDIMCRAKMEETELRQVFNCGIGYTIICDESKAPIIKGLINALGTRCYEIGFVLDK